MEGAVKTGGAKSLNKYGFYLRAAALVVASGILTMPFHGALPWLDGAIASVFPGISANEVAYLSFIGSSLIVGIILIALVLAVIVLERPKKIREFFRLGPIDWTSVALVLGFIVALDVLEALFLRQMVWDPIRLFLVAHGIPGAPSLSIGFAPDPAFRLINVLLLIAILWIEAPEEVFFRGYVQNHLQERIGPNWAMIAGAVVWDAWHLFDPAEFVRRMCYALAFSFVFRLRQNTTALAVVHPLSNRLLMLMAILTGTTGLG